MQRRQQPRARFHQDDARAARVGDPEVARDDIHRELLDRAGQLHPGRAAADDDEGQVRLALGRDPTRSPRARRSAAAASG